MQLFSSWAGISWATVPFATILHHLKSPENVGMIVRSHVAFGGAEIVIVGPEPWRLKKRAQAFSRRLERLAKFVHVSTDDQLFDWCERQRYATVAIEISEPTNWLPEFKFSDRSAVIVGNEGVGIPRTVLDRVDSIVTIPQYGPVACLNSAVSCCIAMYEFSRDRPASRMVAGHRFHVEEVIRAKTREGGSSEL